MTQAERAERRETMDDLKDAIEEIDAELEGALEELREVKARIEALREGKAWREEAYRFLKASKCMARVPSGTDCK